MEEPKQSYYATIPVYILCDSNLTDQEIRMLMVISNLTHRHGYCFAENEYLSKVLHKEKRSVSRILASLEGKGYIKRKIFRDEKNNEVKERRIYVEFMPERIHFPSSKVSPNDKNVITPCDENVVTPCDKNVKYNNKNNNNIYMSEQSSDERAIETPDQQTKPDKKPKKEKPHYEPGSDEYRLADYLYRWKIKFNPGMKPPDLQQWAHCFYRLMHSTKRKVPVTVDDVKYRIEFSQKDPFWRKNIQSAAKLCEQYDRLYDEMSGREQQGSLKIDEKKNVVMIRDNARRCWV
ncbi:MAG: helix-turn-helix domain-containing protein [Massiliimalia sp.]|jgi:DNA-binding MarR family transcriptional regulator